MENIMNTYENISLHDAIARIASEFNNPYLATEQDGTMVTKNAWAWTQKRVIQSMANALYADLFDTRTYTDARGVSRPKGLKLRYDAQLRMLKNLAKNADMANEIDAQSLIKAADFTENLEAQLECLELAYHTMCNVFEEMTGDTLKPYVAWQDYKSQPKEQASSETADAAKRAMARLGIKVKEGYSAKTDGVDTPDAE
jgi:hypothetical protein